MNFPLMLLIMPFPLTGGAQVLSNARAPVQSRRLFVIKKSRDRPQAFQVTVKESAVPRRPPLPLNDIDQRARAIFRQIVDRYLETGEPVGSRTIAQGGGVALSAATIRNVMADLEQMGLLESPHTSAGRVPTEPGLRLFVDAFLEIGEISEAERRTITQRLEQRNDSVEDVLTQASAMLSGLSHGAGLVVIPKLDAPLKHIEFVSTGPGQALVVIVTEDGAVENRIITVPLGMPVSALAEAGNYINAHLRGHTLSEEREIMLTQIDKAKADLDALSARLVEDGLVTWAGAEGASPSRAADSTLIVRGRANLLEDLDATADLERVRQLFDDLENKRDLIQLMDLAKKGEGVRIFIGSENKLFSLSGSSLIFSPYRNSEQKIVGALGVIGPTRLNYARVIPLVDYTARIVGRLMS